MLPPGITPELFSAVTAALFTFGVVLKHAVPRLPNGWIPGVLLVAAVAAFLALADTISAQTVVAAFVAATTAVGSHQLLKQSSKTDL
jgi:hypothetical protein